MAITNTLNKIKTSPDMHYAEVAVYMSLPLKAAESKQNFITGIKNAEYKVVDFSLLCYSESLLAARLYLGMALIILFLQV